jgi:type II secretory pathway component PulF
VPRFSYSALRDDGELVSGQIDAANAQSVAQRLEAVRQHAVKIDQVDGGPGVGGWTLRRRRPRSQDITVFTRELSWLLRAGVTLSRALDMLSGDLADGPMGGVVADMRTAVRSGDTFSDALSRHQTVFAASYVNMVRIAESSGMLGPVLERVADGRDKALKIRRKTQSALIYPAILVSVAIGSIVFILTSVVPRLHGLFGDPGTAMPESTRRLIAVSDWLIANGWLLLFMVAFVVAAGVLALRRPSARAGAFGLALRTPLIGAVMRLSVAAEFCRTLSVLLGAGVGLPMALELMRGAFNVPEVTRVLGGMSAALRRGEDYLDVMDGSWVFPPLMPRMLRVGAETGNLVPALQQLAAMFEDKLEVSVERMLTLLEPIIILALSAAVGFIIMTVMGAIISVNDLAL